MKNKFEKLALLFAIGILLFAIWSNVAAYAENKTATSVAAPPPPPPSMKPHFIRITSPTKDQQVPVGKDLTVSGTSIDNATSNCHVNVIVNDVKPYQNASATGPSGPNDYSKWNFVLTSKYTTIKPGPNKITSKFSCVNTPAIASPHFYSINVTGTTATPQP